MRPLKIIVSGGTGFIGGKLVSALLQQGHYAAVWTRKPGRETRNAVEAFYWDPMQGEPQEESLNGFDVVVHLAGETVAQRWTPEVKRLIRESRVLGTQRLVNAMAKVRHRPAALICASAVGFYGSRGEEALTEASGPGGGFLAEICQEWERAADGAAALGMRVTKVRIGVVLGKDGGALPAMLPAFRAFAGGAFGTGKQWVPWIHVDDLVRMFAHLAENPVEGVWNGCAPEPVSNERFAAALGKALGRPAFLRIPAFALRLAMGEMAEVVLTGQKAYPRSAEAAGFTWLHGGLGEALQDLLN